jgi:NCAIR mutase (PurE)-related protein
LKKPSPASTPHSATDISALLQRVATGGVSVAEAAVALQAMPAEELGFASLDHHRAIQQANDAIVVAGMEGALASVIGGLTAAIDAGGPRQGQRRPVGGRL